MAGRFAFAIALLAGSLSFSLLAHSQAVPALPGCETTPAVRTILDEKLDPTTLVKMKFAERLTLTSQALEDLIATYPREIEPYQKLIDTVRSDDPDELPALRDRLVKMSKDHPDDPLALTFRFIVWETVVPCLLLLKSWTHGQGLLPRGTLI